VYIESIAMKDLTYEVKGLEEADAALIGLIELNCLESIKVGVWTL
jgi:hypothetical protein